MRAISEDVVRAKTLVDEVNVGSQEQTRGIEQVARAVTQMEQVTQSAAASAEEGAAAAEELTAQSESLKAIVERLTAMVGAGATGAGRATAAQRTRRPAIRAVSAAAANDFTF